MTKIRLIGDIHGSYGLYATRLIGVTDSVQVGDFGFGFGEKGTAKFVDKEIFGYAVGRHRMIRGNHDDPEEASLSSHFIPDGTFEDGIMFIGGALSIDKHMRTEGVDYWSGEESSPAELEVLIKKYDEIRPRIVVSHECPEFFARDVMIPLVGGYTGLKSRTRDAFDTMFEIHRPESWIFGHWHRDHTEVYDGTIFTCLGILSTLDLET